MYMVCSVMCSRDRRWRSSVYLPINCLILKIPYEIENQEKVFSYKCTIKSPTPSPNLKATTLQKNTIPAQSTTQFSQTVYYILNVKVLRLREFRIHSIYILEMETFFDKTGFLQKGAK